MLKKRRAGWLIAGGGLLLMAAVPAAAQETLRPGPGQALASPALPPGHWAVRAAERAEALGLAPGYFPAQRAVPRAAVAAALRRAAEAAPPELAALTAGWLARFHEEFPEHRPERSADGVVLLGSAAGLSVEDASGRLEPARGAFEGRVDPVPLPDERRIAAETRLAVGVGPHFAASVEPRLSSGGVVLPAWEAVAGAHGFGLSIGRRPLAYGPAAGGGVVLGGNAPLFRVQLETTRPARLPGILGRAGDVTFHTFGSRLTEERHRGDPWFWGARAAIRPHPRIAVGVNRAAIFGGDSIATPTTLRNIAGMMIGLLSQEFENQLVSLDVRYRLPVDRVLPLTVYVEWGAEDAAGAWWDVPGIVAGAFAPALPGLQEVGAGVEYASLPTFCCGNPPWYFHAAHPGGWVAGGAPLGHPLGGDGRELAVYARGDLLRSRLRGDVRAFARERPDAGYLDFVRAGNVYGPPRFGRSYGSTLDAALRLHRSMDIAAAAALERGDGWSERQLRASVSVFF